MSFASRPIREPRESSVRLQKFWHAFRRIIKPIVHRAYLVLAMHERRRETQAHASPSHRSLLGKSITICIALCAILLLLFGSLHALAFVRTFNPLRGLVSMTKADLQTDMHGHTNILLLGVGDKDHDGADLTDTMIVVSLDAKTKSVVLLSIPRDLYLVQTTEMGTGRINGLFSMYKSAMIAQGKDKTQASLLSMNELGKEVGKLFNINIQYVAKLNFSGFEQAIDLIGGIDVDVPEDIVDNEYPGPNYTYEPFTITAGHHHLDGATALKYARSRHSTSDFSRSARQQQIIKVAVQKMKDAGLLTNIGSLSRLYDILAANFESTMSLREIIALAAVNTEHMVNMNVSDKNGLESSFVEPGGFLYGPPRDQFNGASVLLPMSNSLKTSFDPLRSFGELLFNRREWYIAAPRIAILNAGAKTGSARLLATDLLRYGFDVVHIGNLQDDAKKKIPVSLITFQRDEGSAATGQESQAARESLAQFLVSSLGIQQIKVANSADLESAPQIVIVTGQDFDYRPFHDIIERGLNPSSPSAESSNAARP